MTQLIALTQALSDGLKCSPTAIDPDALLAEYFENQDDLVDFLDHVEETFGGSGALLAALDDYFDVPTSPFLDSLARAAAHLPAAARLLDDLTPRAPHLTLRTLDGVLSGTVTELPAGHEPSHRPMSQAVAEWQLASATLLPIGGAALLSTRECTNVCKACATVSDHLETGGGLALTMVLMMYAPGAVVMLRHFWVGKHAQAS